MHYADTSFLMSLLFHDDATAALTAAFRAMNRPSFVFTPLHELEVRNGIRRREFLQALSLPQKRRDEAKKNRRLAEARLDSYIRRKVLVSTICNWDDVTAEFDRLSAAHTARTGARTLDILHVAFSLVARCERFCTCDIQQATLAKAAGLKVRRVGIDV